MGDNLCTHKNFLTVASSDTRPNEVESQSSRDKKKSTGFRLDKQRPLDQYLDG